MVPCMPAGRRGGPRQATDLEELPVPVRAPREGGSQRHDDGEHRCRVHREFFLYATGHWAGGSLVASVKQGDDTEGPAPPQAHQGPRVLGCEPEAGRQPVFAVRREWASWEVISSANRTSRHQPGRPSPQLEGELLARRRQAAATSTFIPYGYQRAPTRTPASPAPCVAPSAFPRWTVTLHLPLSAAHPPRTYTSARPARAVAILGEAHPPWARRRTSSWLCRRR